MAGLSRSTFTLLQQLTSTDLQAGFRLGGRDLLDALRFLTFDRPVVLGGLDVTATAGGVSVAPGAILQPYPGGSSAPLEDESPSVMGRLGAAAALAIANPGANTWYTIAARWTERDTREPRQVALNTSSGEFEVKQIVVRRESTLELQVIAGTTSALNPAPAGWVPLAGVLRRTTGPTLAGDIYDLRPLTSTFEPTRRPLQGAGAVGEEHFEQHSYHVAGMGPPSFVQLDIELVDRTGLRLSAHGVVTMASLLGPGVVPQPSRWLYLYLSPWRGVAAKTARGRGLLVLTDVAPYGQGSRQNGGPINVLAPYAYTIATSEATCIGALRTTSFDGNQLVPQTCLAGRHVLARRDVQLGAVATLPVNFLPLNARRAQFTVKIGGGDPQTMGLYAPSGGFAVPLSEATHIVSTVLAADATHHPLPPMGLFGVSATDIATVGFPAGSEIALREVEL